MSDKMEELRKLGIKRCQVCKFLTKDGYCPHFGYDRPEEGCFMFKLSKSKLEKVKGGTNEKESKSKSSRGANL